MKRYICVAVITGSMFMASSAMAQQGSWEMSLSGNLESATNSYSGSSTSSASTYAQVDVGRYFTNKLVGRVSLGMFGMDSGGSKASMTNVGVGVKLYFGEPANSKWIPFINGGLNLSLLDSGGRSSSGGGIVFGGGISHFLTEQVSMDLSAQGFYNSMSGSGLSYTNSGARVLFGITARY